MAEDSSRYECYDHKEQIMCKASEKEHDDGAFAWVYSPVVEASISFDLPKFPSK